MPVLSLYVFDRDSPSLAGFFRENHVGHGAGSWAWASWSNLTNTRSTLAWERPDAERVFDLSALANNPLALATIDRLLTGDASRSGPVRTSYVRWDRVHPAVRASDPGRHQPWELLGTLNIDFHISTPWYCTDVDGTLTYYLFFFLDGSGRLRVNADGWSFRYDGGGPFCTGEVSSRLRDAASGAVGTVESQIRTAFDLLTGSSRFSMLYFLPGRGSRSGSASGNADDTVALAVLPR